MSVPLNLVYLIAILPLVIVWAVLLILRKDLKKEIWAMSILVGVLSVITSYYWWTIDWWQPPTIWGTKVGIEDFIMGFAGGGIMATIYEVIFKRQLYKRKPHHHVMGGLTILLLLSQLTSWFVWGVGVTTFWASTLAMITVSIVMIFFRRDLFFNALISGALMLLVSLPVYYSIILLSKEWVSTTYQPALSGILITGIPIEELVFWFLAGFLFGPFYEYWQGEHLRKMK